MPKPTQLSFLDETKTGLPSRRVCPQDHHLPKTYKGIYAMHKYWSKKPYNLIADYIKRFSSPGDIVLDTFCGSGVTVIESVRLNRRAIGIDINPIAVFITQMGLSRVDFRTLKKSFDDLKRELKPIIDSFYRTECPKCKDPNALITHTIWEDECPKEVWYTCSRCKTRKGIKDASAGDLKAASDPPEPSLWYPSDQLIPNYRINAKTEMRVSDLFTKRALVGLSLLLNRINQIEDERIKSTMRFCFTAALPQASKMVFVIRRRGKTKGEDGRGRAEVGSWVIGYWVPKEHFEINVWRCLENRFKRILRGKGEINSVIPPLAAQCADFDDLRRTEEGYWVNMGTASNVPIPSATIDYALVDPPHGNRMPYLELSLMWNSWLGLESDWENEIVISESKSRQKDIKDYRKRLALAFDELWRVLKPDKFLSVVFNSLDDETWLSLLNTCLEAGFDIREIQPLAYSAHSVVQDTRKQALKTDFVITCQKKVPKCTDTVAFFDDASLELECEIANYLAQFINGSETYQVLNHLLVSAIPTGRIHRVSQILKTLETRFGYVRGRWHLRTSL